MLLDRQAIARGFAELLGQLEPDQAEWLDPYRLRTLLVGGDTGAPISLQHQLVVIGSAPGTVRVCPAGLDAAVLKNLPLEGHVRADLTAARTAHLQAALVLVEKVSWEAAQLIDDYTSVLFWLEPDPSTPGTTVLTSATLPEFPHATFITDKALRHIPPNNVAATEVSYPLAENLVHEALHQRLNATMLLTQVMHEDYDSRTAPKIPVPWRGMAAWEPDRVLHATYVYTHVVELRERAMSLLEGQPREYNFIADSYPSARSALDYLNDQLGFLKRHFSDTGWQLVQELRRNATRASAANGALGSRTQSGLNVVEHPS